LVCACVSVRACACMRVRGWHRGLEPGKNFCMDPDELALAADVDPAVKASLTQLQGMMQVCVEVVAAARRERCVRRGGFRV